MYDLVVMDIQIVLTWRTEFLPLFILTCCLQCLLLTAWVAVRLHRRRPQPGYPGPSVTGDTLRHLLEQQHIRQASTKPLKAPGVPVRERLRAA